MKYRFLLTTLWLATMTLPAPAGIFGKKAPSKPEPKDRVSELIVIVKTEKDESKRASAAEELRQYDPKAFAEIVPVLVDVMLNDPKPAVRSEAAQSLGKIRPITNEAGWALEQAMAKDASMRVRLQARSSLLQYHWAGYKPPKDGAPIIETKEPPLAQPIGGPDLGPMPVSAPPRIAPVPLPPPTAQPRSQGRSGPRSSTVVKPANPGPSLVPTDPPLLQPTPRNLNSGGPSLEPQ